MDNSEDLHIDTAKLILLSRTLNKQAMQVRFKRQDRYYLLLPNIAITNETYIVGLKWITDSAVYNVIGYVWQGIVGNCGWPSSC